MRNTCLAISILALATHAAAATPLVRVLLPLYIAQPVPGAYGSVWQSSLVMHNGSLTRTYSITPCPPTENCLIGAADDEVLLPDETQTGLPARYPPPLNPVAGTVLYLLAAGTPPDDADAVAFQLRVSDLSRNAIAAGTEIPVVRESKFRTTTIHLLNVPTDSRFRTSLRLFEMNLDRADFHVRVIDQNTNTVLSERRVTTTTGGVVPQGFAPGFAEINDMPDAAQTAHLRIEIEPLTGGIAFWAYISITNNDSQEITLVTPQ